VPPTSRTWRWPPIVCPPRPSCCRRDSVAKASELTIAVGHRIGPLHGVPQALRDNIGMADRPITAGTAIPRDHRPITYAVARAAATPRRSDHRWGNRSSRVRMGVRRRPTRILASSQIHGTRADAPAAPAAGPVSLRQPDHAVLYWAPTPAAVCACHLRQTASPVCARHWSVSNARVIPSHGARTPSARQRAARRCR
jgi:hypothetical protein